MDANAPPDELDLRRWLEGRGLRGAGVSPLAGDVSPRRYFRVAPGGDPTAIVAWYPPAIAERFEVYVRTTELLESLGVRVPRILECDAEARLMLLEDAGELSLADLPCGSARVERLYERALEFAHRIAGLPAASIPAANPPLDEAFLRRELDQTWRCFLDRELAADPGLRHELRAALDAVCANLGGCPLEPCHRDFMARNLLVRQSEAGDELLVIDHQDLRLGPLGYDIASLLHDSSRLLDAQIARFEQDLVGDSQRDTYARVCVQRLFKIVGTFHAFAARGHGRHLSRVPAALRAAVRQLGTLPEGGVAARGLALRWG